MNLSNLVVAACFLLLGVYLVASSFALPEGMGRLPGPGFFPQVIGAIVLLLAAGLAVQAVRQQPAADRFQVENRRSIAGVIALLLVYLLLWGTGLFVLRSAVLLALFLRFLGESWRASVVVGLVLAVTVTLAFQMGLRVSLE